MKYHVEISTTRIIEVDVASASVMDGEDPEDVAAEMAEEDFNKTDAIHEDSGLQIESVTRVDTA